MARMKRTPYRIPKKKRAELEGVEGRKAHRWRPGTVATREIVRMQKRTDWLIPHAPLCVIIRSIAEENREGTRFSANALAAIHEGVEAYIVKVFSEGNKLTCLEKKQTIAPRHMRAALDIRV